MEKDKKGDNGRGSKPAEGCTCNKTARGKKEQCVRAHSHYFLWYRISMLPAVSPSNPLLVEKVTRLWKERRGDITVFCIVILVGLLSFGLGYMAAQDSARTSIIIEDRSRE